MATYIVVHHQLDPSQPWKNEWIDDDRIATITTTKEVASLCRAAQATGEPIFVHRCGYGGLPPAISCRVRVSEVKGSGSLWLVWFTDQKVVNTPPTVQPGRGQNSYQA